MGNQRILKADYIANSDSGAQSLVPSASGTLVNSGSMIQFIDLGTDPGTYTLNATANVTVIKMSITHDGNYVNLGTKGPNVQMVKIFVTQAAAGGPYSVYHSGFASISAPNHDAWPNPQANQNETDIFVIETFDVAGSQWFYSLYQPAMQID